MEDLILFFLQFLALLLSHSFTTPRVSSSRNIHMSIPLGHLFRLFSECLYWRPVLDCHNTLIVRYPDNLFSCGPVFNGLYGILIQIPLLSRFPFYESILPTVSSTVKKRHSHLSVPQLTPVLELPYNGTTFLYVQWVFSVRKFFYVLSFRLRKLFGFWAYLQRSTSIPFTPPLRCPGPYLNSNNQVPFFLLLPLILYLNRLRS